jgi:hypothetical protein
VRVGHCQAFILKTAYPEKGGLFFFALLFWIDSVGALLTELTS